MSDQIKNIIENMLKSGLFSYEEVVLHAGEPEEMIWFQIKSTDSKSLIGHHGETLSAFNHLVKKIAEKTSTTDRKPLDFFIDINDYQKKKVDSLKTIAQKYKGSVFGS